MFNCYRANKIIFYANKYLLKEFHNRLISIIVSE
jgi:hypothetical protein